MSELKVSIITVVFNAVDTICDTIKSVLSQDYKNVEYIVIDGGSTDGTLDILDGYKQKITTLISEPDSGIYDAMNKGICVATGDVIGFINADDLYSYQSVLGDVASIFGKFDVQACYGDVVFVSDDLRKVLRYYNSSRFTPDRLEYGWMPAHPSLFLKKSLYEQFGYFRTDYLIAADFELVVRMFGVHEISYKYLPKVMVKMRVGGVSTRGLTSSVILNKEIVRACNENGIRTNLLKVSLKVPLKLAEYFVKR